MIVTEELSELTLVFFPSALVPLSHIQIFPILTFRLTGKISLLFPKSC